MQIEEVKKTTLPALVQDQLALDNLLLEVAGDITNPETEQVVMAWAEEVKSGVASKIDNYGFKQKYLKLKIEQFKSEAERYTKAIKTIQNVSDQLKDRVKYAMIEMDKQELIGHKWKYNLTNSKPSVYIVDENKIPAKYKIAQPVVYKLDKDAIKNDIEEGLVVPGASLERSFALRALEIK